MHTATVLPFPSRARGPLRFTLPERNAIITGAVAVSPSWNGFFHDNESDDMASVGALAGGGDRWDAVDSYGIALVTGRQVELLDLTTFDVLGTFLTVAEAIAAMIAHAAAVRY